MVLIQGTEEKPEGWLEGLNLSTNQVGLFPGTYVEYLRTENRRRNITQGDDSGFFGSPTRMHPLCILRYV